MWNSVSFEEWILLFLLLPQQQLERSRDDDVWSPGHILFLNLTKEEINIEKYIMIRLIISFWECVSSLLFAFEKWLTTTTRIFILGLIILIIIFFYN